MARFRETASDSPALCLTPSSTVGFGVQWLTSAQAIVRLVHTGEIKESGNHLLRPSLERFLKQRWIGGADG